MLVRRRNQRLLWTPLACTMASLLVAPLGCYDPPSGPSVVDVQLGKGGGGGPDKGPKVNGADPPSSPPGITLDVHVLGSGFDEGSEATFLLDELPTAHIANTAPTTFVSSSELVAHIEVQSTAQLDLYDIEVQTARGKGGIGIELFAVDQNWAIFDDASGLRVLGDGEGGDVNNDGTVDPNGYADSDPCVRVSTFQVRTVSNTEACKDATDYRVLRLDQTDIAAGDRVDFDQDGTVEVIEQAPARFSVSDNKGKFGCDGNGSLCVTIMVMEVFSSPPPATGQETIWRIRYHNSVSPSGAIPMIDLLGGSAAADVCHHTDEGSGNKGCNPGASVLTQLPFRVTWNGLD